MLLSAVADIEVLEDRLLMLILNFVVRISWIVFSRF